MKTKYSDPKNAFNASRRYVTPPIPFQRPAAKELSKDQYQVYKLRNVPKEKTSPTYELAVPYFSSGTPEEFLMFRENVERVCKGQNVTDGPGKFLIARRLLEGDALAVFNGALPAGEQETSDNFEVCMNAVRDFVFPPRALLIQKRYLRRFVRKQSGQKTRDFIAHLREINNYLLKFPPVNPGEVPQALSDDELLDLLEFGVPTTWQREMVRQDFDPL